MSVPSADWDQSISDTYRELAAVAVPDRAGQIAALLTLIPFAPDGFFKILELSPGEGRLSWAILAAYPKANLLALEFEASMREEVERRLQAFKGRGVVAPYDLRLTGWFENLAGADVVVSSLAVHHLDASEKQRLFRAVAERLNPQGALLLADIILPERPEAGELFAETWDDDVAAASQTQFGSDKAFRHFRDERWNLFRHPDPDFDKPSPLFQQLTWLKEAGFAVVDCFWLQAGHAIYGGYKSAEGSGRLKFRDAYAIALQALQD